MAMVKQRRASRKVLRKGIRQQLQYLRRNFQHTEQLLDAFPGWTTPLPYSLLRKYTGLFST
ncbi:MAG: hypothetical protein Q7T85_08160 [Nitrosomonas sp.]|nr:hypothetical protein [Nitrosomonas sp.]